MIYAYDLLINFNEELYDFYDWKETDSITHIRRIPLYKIDDTFYTDLLTRKIKVNTDYLKEIKDKTQIFSPKTLETIEYACIFTNGENAIAVNFDTNGNVNQKVNFL